MEVIGRRWHEAQLGRWSPGYAIKIIQALERDVFPEIGRLPLVDVDGPAVLDSLRRVEQRGAIDTAKRIRQYVSAIFVFGKNEGLCGADPAGTDLVGSLKPTPVGGSMSGLSDISELRKLHAAVDASSAYPLTKLASRLLGLTFVRPGLVATAKWAEIEGIDWSDPKSGMTSGAPIWRLSAERMKLKKKEKADQAFDHIVPLPPQAVDVLRAVHKLTGRCQYLFHSNRSLNEPMSDSTIGVAYNCVGYTGRHVPHGWRTSFSTIMNERAAELDRDIDRLIIDAMLSHKPRGVSSEEMAYNRAKYMWRRWELAGWWADETTAGLCPPMDLLIGRERAG